MANVRRQRRRLSNIEGRHFVGKWKWKVGNTGVPATIYRIEPDPDADNQYRLEYERSSGQWQLLQTLEYMPDTGTLENLTDDDGQPREIPGVHPTLQEPQRCITFWNCRTRNRHDKCAIFAMRIGPNPPPDDGSVLPISEQDDNGSWGAEEEGGG